MDGMPAQRRRLFPGPPMSLCMLCVLSVSRRKTGIFAMHVVCSPLPQQSTGKHGGCALCTHTAVRSARALFLAERGSECLEPSQTPPRCLPKATTGHNKALLCGAAKRGPTPARQTIELRPSSKAAPALPTHDIASAALFHALSPTASMLPSPKL